MHAVARYTGDPLSVSWIFDIWPERMRGFMLAFVASDTHVNRVSTEIKGPFTGTPYHMAIKTFSCSDGSAFHRSQSPFHGSRPFFGVFVTGTANGSLIFCERSPFRGMRDMTEHAGVFRIFDVNVIVNVFCGRCFFVAGEAQGSSLNSRGYFPVFRERLMALLTFLLQE